MNLSDLLADDVKESKLIPLFGYSNNAVQQAHAEMMYRLREFGAVLVGGCVRDVIFDREVKDIDIFCLSERSAEFIEHALGITLHDVLGFDRSQGRAEYDGDANIFRVYESECKKFNVMVVGNIEQRVCTFPDSISQVVFDGHSLLCTQAFIDTYNTRVITHSHEPMRQMKPERRERLASKYPDFTFKDID
jgi:hypothetical protein